jgi:hypothetical protein
MVFSALVLAVPDALDSADRISAGLAKSPLTYFLALSLVLNVILGSVLYKELKGGNKTAEKLGSILEQHNQSTRALDKAMDFVLGQLPKRRQGHPGELPPVERAAK